MGLDAFVCCDCIREGVATPHPFPKMLAFRETAEPILRSGGEISLEQWLKHDAWYKHSCPHAGRIIDKRLGNIARIGHVRHWLEAHAGTTYPLTKERVVYESTHGGDWIVAADIIAEAHEKEHLETALGFWRAHKGDFDKFEQSYGFESECRKAAAAISQANGPVLKLLEALSLQLDKEQQRHDCPWINQ